jgi:Tfp pilus assembly protein PilF
MGNDVEAAKILAGAIRLAPNSADVRLHAAVVFAARGALAVSESELKEALRLRPALEQSDEVRRLRARLAELAKQ